MRELYIYYRVAAASAGAARTQVTALHRELRVLAPWLRARLLVRPVNGAEEQTWMETYASAGDDDRIDAAFQAEIETRARRLLTAVTEPRHVEVFEACEISSTASPASNNAT